MISYFCDFVKTLRFACVFLYLGCAFSFGRRRDRDRDSGSGRLGYQT